MTLTASEALRKFWRLPTDSLPWMREWVYFLESHTSPPLVKIGKTQSVRWRMVCLQSQCPVALTLIGCISAPAGTEKVIHAKFKDIRQHGEWFLKTDHLREFIRSLPKGEAMPIDSVVNWVQETGVPLSCTKTRKNMTRLTDDEARERRDSLYWGRPERP